MPAHNPLPSEFDLDSLSDEYYKNASADATKHDALEHAELAHDVIARNVSLPAAQLAEDMLEYAVAHIEAGTDNADTINNVACGLVDALVFVDETHFAGADDVAGAIVECLHVILGDNATFEVTDTAIRCKRAAQ